MLEGIRQRHDLRRAGKFGVIGIINTLLDFTIFNVETKYLGLQVIPANIVSTTIAMVFSFTANRQIVFGGRGKAVWRQGVSFLAVTAVGLYVIQLGIIHLLVIDWPAPLHLGVHIVRGLGINVFSDGFYINNGAKAIATVASLAWNYIMYKRVVFR